MRKAVIHSTAEVSPRASIGESTQVWHGVQIREGVTIGNECVLGKSSYIDFDVHIGNRCKIQNNASIFHGATVEDGVFIGPHACITNDRLPRAITPEGDLKTLDDWIVGPTHLKYGCSIGAGAIVLPGVTIGRFALVGSGAIVTRDVPDHGLVVGNPARLAGYVCACGGRLAFERGGHDDATAETSTNWFPANPQAQAGGHCSKCGNTTVLAFEAAAHPGEKHA
ncbi:MAG: hexapeptide repeat-containing transferase [Chloroflexi bacterium]|jgi:UDP-2-acetamido-3-amino-2,3-dideoxy-glucuronate N-acetyltransferase|nr:hexapeptide repeat-containing transferase [Chloroflexota bacterium]